MANKITLADTKSGYNRSTINNNFQKIQTDLNDKVLYRDNPDGEPNQMESDIDMNSNDIANAKDIYADRVRIDGKWVIASEETSARDAATVTYDSSGSSFTTDSVQSALDESAGALDKRTIAVDTVADLKALPGAKPGLRVSTAGYYTSGDGGGNEYEVVAAGTGTDDGGSFIDLNDGAHQAKALINEFVNVKWFGAVPSFASDLAPMVQKAANHISLYGGGFLYFPSDSNEYKFTSVGDGGDACVFISGLSHLTIAGDGFSSKIRNTDSTLFHCFGIANTDKITITGLYLEGRDPTAFSGGHRAINMNFCQDVTVTECYLKNWGRYAISHQDGAAKRFLFDNLIFEGIGNDCIDIKNKEAPANPTELLVVSNILAKSWGVTGDNSPNAVIDVRMPVSVTNVRGLDMRAGNRVVRVENDDCIISNVFGEDNNSDEVARTGTNRTAVVNIQGKKNVTVTGVHAKGATYGVWPDGTCSNISIVGGTMEDCSSGVIASTVNERISVTAVNFKNCGIAFKTDAPYSTIIGCHADACGKFLEVSAFSEYLTVIGNTVQNSTTTAWSLPGALETKMLHTFLGNTTDIGGAGASFLRSRGNVAFSAISANEAHTSYLESQTGGGAVRLSAQGGLDNIDLQLSPKGSGLVQFEGQTLITAGTFTLSGYISVKDAAGATIRLGVVTVT